jgi:WD40 repeat protein
LGFRFKQNCSVNYLFYSEIKYFIVFRTLKGHQNTIRALAVDTSNNYIISGSEDKTIKVWEYESGKMLKTLREHLGEVFCLELDRENNLLITGSGDKTVKLWDIRTWSVTKTLKAHDNKLFCLQVTEMKIIYLF